MPRCPEALPWMRRLMVLILALLAVPAVVAQAPEIKPAKIQIRGLVVDEHNQPVAGAIVSSLMVVTGPSQQGTGMVWAMQPVPEQTTNDQGAFSIAVWGGATGTVLRLRARHQDAFTAKSVEVQGEALEKPVSLRISPKNARALSVRVVDEDGEPIPGANITVHHQPTAPPPYGSRGIAKPVALPSQVARVTNTEGRLETPRCLDPDGAYQLEIKAQGFLPEKTAAKEMGDAGLLAFGDVMLRQLRPLAGQVLDRQGKPIAEASVVHVDNRQRVAATTDKDGRFQLQAAVSPSGLLFVDKAGFRFHGQRCNKRELLKITLTRRSEPVEKRFTTLSPALPRAERKVLASRVLEPLLKPVLEDGTDDARLRPLEALAKVDAGRLLAELEKRPYKNPWYDAYLRRAAAKSILVESAEEARSIIDSMKDPGFRCAGYLDLCDALPKEKRSEKLAYLNQALLHSRSIEASDHRVIDLGWIAKRLWALGEKERAAKLLREGQAIAKELPTAAWAGYARGAFAEDLALIDLPAALELMKDLKDPFEYVRHHGNLACKLASTHPSEAERVFGMLLQQSDRQQAFNREHYAIRLSYRMAAADLPRARKLAETIHDARFKARAFAGMAQALAKSRPQEALALLDQAWSLLGDYVVSGRNRSNPLEHAVAVAGLMIPIAEQIDPALAPEFFWHTLSLRGHAATGDRVDYRPMGWLGAMALVLARYDRELTMALVEEVPPPRDADFYPRPAHLLAAALADPRRAVALLEQLLDGRTKDNARWSMIEVLLSEGEALERVIHGALNLGYMEDEDL